MSSVHPAQAKERWWQLGKWSGFFGGKSTKGSVTIADRSTPEQTRGAQVYKSEVLTGTPKSHSHDFVKTVQSPGGAPARTIMGSKSAESPRSGKK